MIYSSTRDSSILVSSKEAILRGISPEGGLFVSPDLPLSRIDMEGLRDKSFKETAFLIMSLLMDDYSEGELRDSIDRAYDHSFESVDITPVSRIGRFYLLELYHGPTQAFKDIALSILPGLMKHALGGDERLMILTATSGDTGKAALEGFKDEERIAITVFYPYGGVSDIQYLQMATQEGDNTFVAAVRGNFDDCQTNVKGLFSSLETEAKQVYHTGLSSANSINIGRLIPQIVYYVFSYMKILKEGAISFGEKVDYVVPTGNFGDVLAGYYALLLGLPIGKLVVCSNTNKILTDFFETGVYDTKREFFKTLSPSMDILVSSNLERMLYYASGCDSDYVSYLMKNLSQEGSFRVNDKVLSFLRSVFDFGFSSDDETKKTIKNAYERYGRLIDPHSAVALKVANERGGDSPTVILSTASPFKFARDVYESIFGTLPATDGFSYMKALSSRTGIEAPLALKALKDKKILHNEVISPSQMRDFVIKGLKSFNG